MNHEYTAYLKFRRFHILPTKPSLMTKPTRVPISQTIFTNGHGIPILFVFIESPIN